MKKSRYTEEQVAYALRLAESGTPVADLTLDKQILHEVIRKTSKASSQTGAGSVGAGPLPGELPARVCAGADLSEYLVLQVTGARRRGASHADP